MFSVGFFAFCSQRRRSVGFWKGWGSETPAKTGWDVSKDGADVGKDEVGRQCASSQFFPVPQSAMSGTLMEKACSISLMTSSFTRSSSSGGTLKLSSSCT